MGPTRVASFLGEMAKICQNDDAISIVNPLCWPVPFPIHMIILVTLPRSIEPGTYLALPGHNSIQSRCLAPHRFTAEAGKLGLSKLKATDFSGLGKKLENVNQTKTTSECGYLKQNVKDPVKKHEKVFRGHIFISCSQGKMTGRVCGVSS